VVTLGRPPHRARGGHQAMVQGKARWPGWHHCQVIDPYVVGACRWWHLSAPSPELVEAHADGWLGTPGTVVDIGCGLGTEVAYLAANGWHAVGVDLSDVALARAKSTHGDVSFIQADATALPFPAGVFHLALDRGCFHYLNPSQWADYAAEAWRVLQPGGRLLLRACLTSRGARNEVTESGISEAFAGWLVDSLEHADLQSDTRTMEALVIRLRRD
jgi:SAM-dependent methyltransferase